MTRSWCSLVVLVVVSCTALLGWGAPAFGQPPAVSLEGRTVNRVDVVGNERISDQAVRVTARTREGEPLRGAVLDQDVKRVHALGFYEVDVFVEPDGDGVVVRFEVKENARIASVKFKGMKKLERGDVDAAVGLKPGQFISDMILEIVTRDIERLYDQKGFLFADVKAQKRATAEGIDLTIRVIEGPRVAVEDIKIVGNKHLTAKQLRRIIRTKSSGFIRNRYIDREVLDQDVIAIRNWYRAEGYRDVKVNLGDVWFNQSRRRASITIFVEEGVRYQVRDIRFEGNTLFTEEELRSSIGMTSGEFLVDRFVARDRQRIQRMYGKQAYIDARVVADPLWDDRSPGVCDLVFRIEEGEKVFLGKLRIDGNRLTKEKVIRREISLSPGDPIDFEEVRRSYNRLAQSSYFVPEAIRIEADDAPGNDTASIRDYTVSVEEGQTGFIRFSVGVGSNSGIVGDISLIKRNFDIGDLPESFSDVFAGEAFTGAGQTFTIQLSPGTELSRFRVAFEEPFLFDTKNSLNTEVFRRIRLRPEWDETRQGGRISLGRYLSRFNPDLSVHMRWRAEQVTLDDFGRDAPQDAYDWEGRSNLMGLGPSIVYRQLDAPVTPTKGFRAELGYEYVGMVLGGDVDMNRVTGNARGFFPVYEDQRGRRHVVTVWSRLGWSEATRKLDRVPIFERFFAGGRESIRGFEFRGVGPRQSGGAARGSDEPVGGDVLAVGGVEYGFPLLAESLRGVLFVDTGTVSESVDTEDMRHFRAAAGFGFRLRIPFLGQVPLALDFGFPFFEQDEDDTQTFSFTLGAPVFGF